jgi:hypothetical protein
MKPRHLLTLALMTASSGALGQTAPAPAPAAAPAPAPTAALAPAPTAGARLPFPAPVATTPSDDTKYSNGVVTAVDPAKKRFDIGTPAGPLTCQFEQWSRVMGADGKPTAPDSVRVGTAVRVYYKTGHGAQLQEVDLVVTQ